jgi:hypothetical protein
MAKFELKFLDFKKSALSIFVKKDTNFQKDFIKIQIHNENSKEFVSIDLDKSTAIKFAKTLRTEINKITESEVNNG